jgi:hypothetical protein
MSFVSSFLEVCMIHLIAVGWTGKWHFFSSLTSFSKIFASTNTFWVEFIPRIKNSLWIIWNDDYNKTSDISFYDSLMRLALSIPSSLKFFLLRV